MRKAPVCELLNKAETEELLRCYTTRQRGWWLAGEERFFMPYGYQKNAESIFNLRLRESDKWIVTFPRSGTTWILELTWLLNNNLDYEKALTMQMNERVYFVERTLMLISRQDSDGTSKQTNNYDLRGETIDSLPSPRFLKTHLPFQLLPPDLLDVGCKVVYVARNPKDVLVSDYRLNKAHVLNNFTKDLSVFWKLFRRGLDYYCPYFSHVKKAWSLRNSPNLLFLFYEEMKMDLPGVIRKVSKFYDRRCTEEEIAKLVKHLDIESFKNNPTIGPRKFAGANVVPKDVFVGKGQIGGWKDLFTPELEAEVDLWIEENLRDTDLVFPYASSK